jgi:hypothetical protein
MLSDHGSEHRMHQSRVPEVSVIVVLYNMRREAVRTLMSLSARYQRNIQVHEYEVIVVDNGSRPAVSLDFEGLEENFRLIRIEDASPSPARAVNIGIAAARGEVIGVMIDGARIASPGMLHFARHGARLYDTAVVATLGYYLGYDFQRWSMQVGYDQAREDELLASIAWPHDGYRLFEISTLDESSVEGWFCPIAESNALFLRREHWEALQGMDERFDLPGGGLVNLDTFERALRLSGAQLVILLGEGTFHQLHGGVATNALPEQEKENWPRWAAQYEQIRGRPYAVPVPTNSPTYVGTMPRATLLHFVRAVVDPTQRRYERPFGPNFDRDLWTIDPPKPATDPVVAALIDLAQANFRSGDHAAVVSIARLIRSRAPDEPEPQRLLSLVPRALDEPAPRTAEYFAAFAKAHQILGEDEQAKSQFQRALTLNRNLVQAHVGLATLRMPGDFYYKWIEYFYTMLAPEFVIEIGVADGASLALVRPPTVAIGVDPYPTVAYPPKAETYIFPETSDAFFARDAPKRLLAGRPVGVGFIDGLHLFEQTLRDFINLERYCGPRSVILFHDTVPLDDATQRRACDTQFHTGDVWKIVLCLKAYRPDLDVFTIATPWTGLTVVTGLDPSSGVLANLFNEAVERFIDMPYAAIENDYETILNVVPNNRDAVEARLRARGISVPEE